MGHRKRRKQARKAQTNRWDDERLFAAPAIERWVEPEEPAAVWQWQDAFNDSRRPAVQTCGSCREFVEELENGRGTCLHPGSGVLSPWSDTEACPFFAGVRRIDGRR
jgi:hypothetical protein